MEDVNTQRLNSEQFFRIILKDRDNHPEELVTTGLVRRSIEIIGRNGKSLSTE